MKVGAKRLFLSDPPCPGYMQGKKSGSQTERVVYSAKEKGALFQGALRHGLQFLMDVNYRANRDRYSIDKRNAFTISARTKFPLNWLSLFNQKLNPALSGSRRK